MTIERQREYSELYEEHQNSLMLIKELKYKLAKMQNKELQSSANDFDLEYESNLDFMEQHKIRKQLSLKENIILRRSKCYDARPMS